jgi:hypothetical protein
MLVIELQIETCSGLLVKKTNKDRELLNRVINVLYENI